ncbi:MAG: hypothetical protein ACR2J5_03915 [Geodermatophilaceae bacterium]
MPPRQSNAGGASPADPAAARRRWSSQREAHLQQVNAFTFLFPARLKRSATRMPAALRYAEHLPASRTVRILLGLAVPAYVGLQLSQDVPLGRAALLAVLLALLIGAVSTYRLTVGNAGISFDIPGLRQVSSFGFVPLYAIRAARAGRPPEGWPRARLKGGWWPGRRRVSVLHADDAGTMQAFYVWVSDPEAFGTALLGRPMSDQD